MRVNLSGGTYEARSLASSAQTCLNLVPEATPPGEDSGAQAHYLTPGLIPLNAGTADPVRGIYYPGGTGANIYVVCGPTVYNFNATTFVLHAIGAITNLATPVSMQGSGQTGVIVIVDGSTNGWYIDEASQTTIPISDPNFKGASTVLYLDTFLIFNEPGSLNWYSSPSNYAGNSTPFDPLFVAQKDTYVDIIMGMATVNQVIWILGAQTTELWVDVGAADFPFQRVPEVLIQHGCVATYSIDTADGSVFWLSQDLQGRNMVLQGQGYEAKRISTPALEWEWSNYAKTSDANGMTYSQAGHTYYVLSFPSANTTWVYDLSTNLWHQRSSPDSSGNQNQYNMNCVVSANGIYAGDIANGTIYRLVQNQYTDNGLAVMRQRAFPHMIGTDADRVMYRKFVADVSITNFSATLHLDWSDDRGVTYGTPLGLSFSGTQMGSMTWWRLGISRDRVFRLTWQGGGEVALLGAWVVVDAVAS